MTLKHDMEDDKIWWINSKKCPSYIMNNVNLINFNQNMKSVNSLQSAMYFFFFDMDVEKGG